MRVYVLYTNDSPYLIVPDKFHRCPQRFWVVYLGFDPVFVSAAGLSLSSTTQTPRVVAAVARASQPRSLIVQPARHVDCFGFQLLRC